jgi:hypothetical protein
MVISVSARFEKKTHINREGMGEKLFSTIFFHACRRRTKWQKDIGHQWCDGKEKDAMEMKGSSVCLI